MNSQVLNKAKQVLLLGGGHANLQVMHELARIDRSRFKLTLVSDVTHSPYSGMLPSYLAGVYKESELHFDLKKICDRFDFEFIHDGVAKINHLENKIETISGKAISYDFCSINLGIVPTQIPAVSEPKNDVIYIKPISKFIHQWHQTLYSASDSSQGLLFSIIGGGAGAFEVAVATRRRFPSPSTTVRIFTGSGGLLPEHNLKARALAGQSLKKLNIELIAGARVSQIENSHLKLDDGRRFERGVCLIATSAQAPEIFRSSKMPISDDGFVKVDEHLLVTGCNNIFASGDCCYFSPRPLPKAGVFAVRQGPIVSKNLTTLIMNQNALTKYSPQSRFLTLLVSGDQKAIASYGDFAFESQWAWRLKDFIDQKFMKKFS